MDWSDLRATLEGVDLSALIPLHDFVLVKQLPEEALIIKSPVHMTRDYRWRSDRPKGLRRGVVIACGRGDKIPIATGNVLSNGRDVIAITERAPMHVKPGDVVVYPQTPSNDVMLNGELHSFIHEEQHVLGVIEPEEPAESDESFEASEALLEAYHATRE